MKKRIFVVEDEAVVAMELEDHLRAMGYEVAGHAVSGEAALRQIPEARADLVLMDINLTGKTTGLDVTEQLRGVVDVPVIFLTAYSDETLTARAARTSSFAFIIKPFEVRELRANIELALVRHQADRALRESERRYRRIFDEALESIYEVDLDGTIVRVNPAYAHMLGYASTEELVGENQGQFYVDPAARGRIQQKHAGSGKITGVEAVWRRKDGELLQVEIYGREILGERGEPVRYHGIVRDVTARRQREATLRFLSTGLTRVGSGDFFDHVAAQLAAITGAEIAFIGTIRPGTATTLRTEGLVIDGAVSRALELGLQGTPCERVKGGATVVRTHGVRQEYPNDARFVALGVEGYAAAPLLEATGRVIGVIGVMTRKPIVRPERIEGTLQMFALRTAAELERQRAEGRFAEVFEFAPDAMLMVDDAGRIVTANRAAEGTFGYSHDELLQRSVEDLIPDTHRHAHVEHRATFRSQNSPRRMGSARAQLWTVRKDGTRLPVEISLSPLDSPDGRLVVAAVRDVSARVRAETQRAQLQEQLRQAQRLESLGTLAGGIAHDFNNLLAAISANVELARDEVAPTHPVSECLDEIGTASTRARDLVRQILAFSRKQVTVRTVSPVRPVVEEVTRLLRATIPAGILIVSDLSADVLASLDPTQIHQVLMNLGTNAWQAMERTTGRISFQLDVVTVEAEDPPVAGMAPGRYARIRVSDDGKGMDDATRARIFEPFFTTKDIGKGTGLGLAVVHGIVADHSGAIAVESTPGAGSTFSVYLPEARGQTRTRAATTRPTSGGAEHVLLIDDEDALLRTSRRILERLGYEVTTFSRPAEAVAAVRADPHRFDVVITDQSMPEMDGFEVAEAIRAVRPALPILLISGNPRSPDEELAALNVTDYMGKPFTGQALGEAVARVLGRG